MHINISKLRSRPRWPLFSNLLTYVQNCVLIVSLKIKSLVHVPEQVASARRKLICFQQNTCYCEKLPTKEHGRPLLLGQSKLYKNISTFEKRGHLCPDLNIEILICTQSIGNQLSFTVCLMFIASWIHFQSAFI